MNNDSPYMVILDVVKRCRGQLVEDTLKNASIDLYDALYTNVESEICATKIELYELEWIELHWKRITEAIEVRNIDVSEKKRLLSMSARWYMQFMSNWNYSDLDTLMLGEKINILRTLVSINSEWEQNLQKIKVSFVKSEKKLKTKIKELEKEVEL